MKMSVTNTRQRRISLLSFLGLFLLAVLLSSMAVVKSMGLKETLPKEELMDLKGKEKILASFSDLSQALCKYDDSQRTNARSVNRDLAACQSKLAALYQDLEGKDTARIYKDITHFMRMADQYFLSIKELGQETDARMKVIEEKLTQLRTANTNLQTQNTSLQTEKNQLQLGSANLQTQISNLELMLQQSKASGGGGGGGEKDCVAEINKYHQYKGSIIKQAGTMQLTLATINNELKSMDGFFGIGKNKSEKEKIKQALEQLAKSIEAVSK